MRTKIVYISGAHGVGKDTIIEALAKKMESIGLRVYVLPEMPFPPDLKIGTMAFQKRYERVMAEREVIIPKIADLFDIILCNRHPVDVDIYTSNIIGIEAKTPTLSSTMWIEKQHYLITCPPTVVEGRLKERNKVQTWRKDWNEDDMDYFENIQNLFEDVLNDLVWIVNTVPVEESVDRLLGLIL